MRPVEIIALIVAVIGLVKLAVIVTQPKSWLSLVKKVYAKPQVTMAVSLVLALIIIKYLLQEMTIVQVFAAMGLVMAITAASFAAFGKEIIDFAETIFKKKNLIAQAWPLISVWTILIIWVLVVILG